MVAASWLSPALFFALLFGVSPGWANGATWPMKQRDRSNGRADYTVARDADARHLLRQSSGKHPAGEGGFTSTSMVFFDGVGPGGRSVLVGGYHWPKGVPGMDRHTGRRSGAAILGGGESIGANTPAFSVDGATVHVTVAFECANDPHVAGVDFRYVAAVEHAALAAGTADDHPEDDTCPRPPRPTPGHRDPDPNGSWAEAAIKNCSRRAHR